LFVAPPLAVITRPLFVETPFVVITTPSALLELFDKVIPV